MADLTEQIYQRFKQDIMDDKFPLDEMIIEQDLVERLEPAELRFKMLLCVWFMRDI